MPETDTATHGITTGELSRAVELIRGDIGHLRTDVNTKPDWQDVRRIEEGLVQRMTAEKERVDLKNLLQDKAIEAGEEWRRWALRLGAPALVAAMVGMAANAIRLTGSGS
jgi:hypothetical protein